MAIVGRMESCVSTTALYIAANDGQRSPANNQPCSDPCIFSLLLFFALPPVICFFVYWTLLVAFLATGHPLYSYTVRGRIRITG
jgi:hypothetical protein